MCSNVDKFSRIEYLSTYYYLLEDLFIRIWTYTHTHKGKKRERDLLFSVCSIHFWKRLNWIFVGMRVYWLEIRLIEHIVLRTIHKHKQVCVCGFLTLEYTK